MLCTQCDKNKHTRFTVCVPFWMGHFDLMWIRRADDTFEAGYIYLVEYFNWLRYVKNIKKKYSLVNLERGEVKINLIKQTLDNIF